MVNRQALAETHGWTPEDMDNMDAYYLNAFSAILRGRSKGLKDRMKQ